MGDLGDGVGGCGVGFGFVLRRGNGFSLFGLGVEDGFVLHFCELGAEGLDAVEIFDGAAVEALGLGLIAEEPQKSAGLGHHALEALGDREAAVLGSGDLDIVTADELGGHGEKGEVFTAAERLVETGGKDAAFEAGRTEEGLLGESDALDGEELLGVDGAVDGDQVGAEVGDVVEFFEADDGEGGGGEFVFAGVLGGGGFAFRGARPGGVCGIGLVGG